MMSIANGDRNDLYDESVIKSAFGAEDISAESVDIYYNELKDITIITSCINVFNENTLNNLCKHIDYRLANTRSHLFPNK